MTPPTLDFDALLKPIPGEKPAGRSVPFETRQKLDDARKEIDPSSFAPNDPLRPTEVIRADWPLIRKLSQQVLTTSSKDLLMVARLTESLTKLHGFAGVRDGLTLFRRLFEECWDRILPEIEEEDDIEARGSALYWLDDADRGARFPFSIRLVRFIGDEDELYSWLDWKRIQTDKESDARDALAASFEKGFKESKREQYDLAVADLSGALEELNTLVAVLNSRMGSFAPSLLGIRGALEDCQALAQQMLAKKGPAPASATDTPAAEAAPSGNGAPTPAAATVPTTLPTAPTRAQVYRQIAAAAAALRDIEPHSPIPYLLERAVELGGLPFPELMKVLVRDAQVISSMNRELGIKETSD